MTRQLLCSSISSIARWLTSDAFQPPGLSERSNASYLFTIANEPVRVWHQLSVLPEPHRPFHPDDPIKEGLRGRTQHDSSATLFCHEVHSVIEHMHHPHRQSLHLVEDNDSFCQRMSPSRGTCAAAEQCFEQLNRRHENHWGIPVVLSWWFASVLIAFAGAAHACPPLTRIRL